MRVQPVDNINMGSKHTYLQRSKCSVTKLEKDYFKSLHKEAMARKSYLDYRKADADLSTYDGCINSLGDAWEVIKIFARMASKKLESVVHLSDAHIAFPNRFIEPDNKYIYPHRYYQLKSFSGDALPSQIKRY